MIVKEIKVLNRSGLHTRPAASIVKVASKYKAEVEFERDGFKINAKSIIGVMTLAAEQGAILKVHVSGTDEEDAINELEALFKTGFGEL